jgi:murein DD-endopeptidase MepM/ murein hydrolase activator NlpD
MPRPHRRRASRIAAAAVLCVSGLLGSGVTPISADDVSNASSSVSQASSALGSDKSKSAAISGVIDKLTGEIAALSTRVEQLKAAISTLDGEIAQQQGVVTAAQATLQKISDDLDAANLHLTQTRAKLQVDQQGLAAQIIHLYELGPTSTVNAIFSSDNFDELWQKIIAAKRVGDAEQGQVDNVKAERTQVEQLVAQISADKDQQTQVVAQQQAAEKTLEQDRASEADLQNQLQQAEAADQAQQLQLEANKREVDAQVAADAAQLSQAEIALKEAQAAAAAAAAAGSFRGGGNGHFLWPLQGNITQYFGCTSWPYEPYDASCPYPHAFHTGLDISNVYGTPIVAADTGIAYTYYSGYGYGNHVIIIHANGWSTLYGHMAAFVVGNGQVVGRGQTIGYEGSTGNSSGPHCHFEIRLNNNYLNPLDYLP